MLENNSDKHMDMLVSCCDVNSWNKVFSKSSVNMCMHFDQPVTFFCHETGALKGGCPADDFSVDPQTTLNDGKCRSQWV